MTVEQVGGLFLPIPAGSSLSEFTDNGIKGLVDFYSFYIKLFIDDKLANLPPTSADAVPVANRFLWSPEHYFVQNQFPAIYGWEEKSQYIHHTLVYHARQRTICFAYFFNELAGPGGLNTRYGLVPAIDAAVHTANNRGHHPNYSFNGDAPGTPIWRTLNFVKAELGECTLEQLASIPDVQNAKALGNIGQGHVSRFFPCLKWSMEVTERITKNLDYTMVNGQVVSAVDPATVLGESNLDIQTDLSDPLDYKTVNLPPPDGSNPND